jgi:hypothetical protein
MQIINKSNLTFFLALGIASTVLGQTINFQGGKVFDSQGNPLSGAGFSAQLWAGSTPDPTLMSGLTPITTFQSGAQAGNIVTVSVAQPFVPPGSTVSLQVRVWDNKGGTISTYAAAVADGSTRFGTGAVVQVVVPAGTLTPPPPSYLGLFGFSISFPPTISGIANQRTSRDTTTAAIPFTVGDIETPVNNLVVSAQSSNPSLVPNANLVLSGSGATRSLTAIPAAGQSGHTTISVTVTDSEGKSATTSFILSVSYIASAAAADGTAGSLRQLIITANGDPGPDFIELPTGTYSLTISGANEDAAATGDLDITDDLVISGAGAGSSIIDGSALSDRVFQVIGSAVNVTLSGVTIQGGNLSGAFRGGGILSNGHLTLQQCLVQNCSALAGAGGGIYSMGSLVVNKTTVSSNGAQTAGGIYASDGPFVLTDSTISSNTGNNNIGGVNVTNSTATFVRSRITGNTAPAVGGIQVISSLSMDRCEVSLNNAAQTAGLQNSGTLTLTNCTFSRNSSSATGTDASALYTFGGTVDALNCTFASNSLPSAAFGGGIISCNSVFTARNSIFAGNTVQSTEVDFYQGLVSAGHNLLQSTLNTAITGNTAGNITGVDPLLGPLQNNGGPTFTHALLVSSPAIDAGDNTGVPTTDQRGLPRIFGGTVDIGAFESQPTLVVVNTSDSGAGSLRQAIIDANATAGVKETIIFNIPGTGVQTIKPLTPLPIITDPVIIDGYTQPGASINTSANSDNAVLQIELDGESVSDPTPSSIVGLRISAGNSTVRGLVINRFAYRGISIDTQGGNSIQGNFIGTDAGGTVALGNGSAAGPAGHGILIFGTANNTIGGTSPDQRNIISANAGEGIDVAGDSNTIQGNMIGVDRTGTLARGNTGDGILIGGNANVIGGTTPQARNVISGNLIYGINCSSGTGNLIQGNYIGTDPSGTLAVRNITGGLIIQGANNTIGGVAAGAGNIISGNSLGLFISGATTTGIFVQGNLIGLQANGTSALGNLGRGIMVQDAHDNFIGGNSSAARNTISGNGDSGVALFGLTATGNTVQGNYVGTTVDGLTAVPNANGVRLSLSANINKVKGNIISGNTGNGVTVDSSGTTGNFIDNNYIGTTPNGANVLPNGGNGVQINGAANNTIGVSGGGANVISGNSQNGINITGAASTGNLVQGNIVGLNAAGNLALPNTQNGILINLGPNNTIGGTTAVTRNIISGNGNNGVWINQSGATGNIVEGNYIGTDIGGTVALGNVDHGVLVQASGNTIGGATAGAANLISGNLFFGIDLNGDSNTVQGNLLGTDASGSSALGNAFSGIQISGNGNIVGGGSPGARNVISGNQQGGVVFVGAATTGNMLQGNFIGTDVSGAVSLGNVNNGIVCDSPGNFIGGASAGQGNLISGSPLAIYLTSSQASGNTIQGNLIGTDLSGTTPQGTVRHGITIQDGHGNLIGGASPGAGNVIAASEPVGIQPAGISIIGAAATGNRIQRNSIFANAGPGIDLGSDLQTPNDPGDSDTGPNNLQNFPVMTSAQYDLVNLTIQYSVDSTVAASAYPLTVEFFIADPSGQGKTFIGSDTYSTPQAVATASFVPTANVAATDNIVATATDASGNTSEFSFPATSVHQTKFIVTNTGDSGPGSLRQAILDANTEPGTETITFNITGPAPHTIRPLSPLPPITGPVIIDGYTQPGSSVNTLANGDNAVLTIEIDGTLAGSTANGLTIAAGNSTVRGLVINRFNGFGIGQGSAIVLSGNSGNTIEGNFLGLNTTGTVRLGNSINDITILDSSNNLIGGAASASRNILSGVNNDAGVYIKGVTANTTATGNQVVGNYIGTDASGTVALGNVSGVTIFFADGNTIGGTATGSGNLIAGNTFYGVEITGSHANSVQGNLIGTTVSGLAALPNVHAGILITDAANSNSVGGSVPAARNVISGNSGPGVIIRNSSNGNSIQGNFIGFAADGNSALGNSQQGVLIDTSSANNSIGGASPANANLIAFNSLSGVTLSSTAGTGNAILGNPIFQNAALGIDLGNDGPTLNDPGDPDTGPNRRQNYPQITGATLVGTSVTLNYLVDSMVGNASYPITVQFFVADASGLGGQTLLFTDAYPAVQAGFAKVATFTSPVSLSGNESLVATATDAAGNTSEFSPASASFLSSACPGNINWPAACALNLSQNQNFLHGVVFQSLDILDETRWYKFPVSPGSQLIVTLTDLPDNYDLFLFQDIAASYQELTSPTTTTLAQLGAEFAPTAFSPTAFSPTAFSPTAFSPTAFSPTAFSPTAFSPTAFSPTAFSPTAFSPTAFSPTAFSPTAFSPTAFSPTAFSPTAFSPTAFSPTAFSAAQTRSLVGVSAFPGLAGEGILLNTWENSGNYYVCVHGRNGAFAPGQQFQLDIFETIGTCPTLTPSAPLVAAPAGNFHTIIVTDVGRMNPGNDPILAQQITTMQQKLSAFATRAEVQGVLVDLGGIGTVRTANSIADQNVGCTFAKNIVAQAIKDVITSYEALNPLEYVVLVGNDSVIPYFRHPDLAGIANENDYYPPVLDNTSSQAALRLGEVLSQDDYGSICGLSINGSTFPIPDLAVGRLVEQPAEVSGQLDSYPTASSGVIPVPTSALVSGYDFMVRPAVAVSNEFRLGIGTASGTLNDGLLAVDAFGVPLSPQDPNAWTAVDLRHKLVDTRHDLVFLGAHFSEGSALAADWKTVLTAAEIAASPANLVNAIVLGAGCHVGYNTVDPHVISGVTLDPDWPQAFAIKQVGAFIGGTGYQYGDTDFVEYNDRLYVDVAQQLRSGTGPVSIGKALMAAKRKYLSDTAVPRDIHEKTVLQTTLFGLPMLSVNLPSGRGAVTGVPPLVSPPLQSFGTPPGAPAPVGLGLQYTNVTISTASLNVNTVTLAVYPVPAVPPLTVAATYLSGSDGQFSNPGEPVLPLIVKNATVPNTVLRGVGFLSAHYADQQNVRPLTGAPATEIRGVSVPFQTPVFYPIQPWSVNYYDGLCNAAGGNTRLMLFPAQYKTSVPGSDVGTRRTFSDISFRLYYSSNTQTYVGANNVPSTPSLADPPSVSGVSADVAGGQITFRAHVVGNPAAGIQEVWVTYTAVTTGSWYGQWQSVNLTQQVQPVVDALHEDSTLWVGSVNLPIGTVAQDVRYLVQAVNGVGLVTMDTRQGAFYTPGNPAVELSTLGFGSFPSHAPYGSTVTFSATLSDSATAATLGNQPVIFGLGSQQLLGTTDGITGQATAKMQLLGAPATYLLQATFPGTDTQAHSSATTVFTIDPQATQIALIQTGPQNNLNVMATLTDVLGQPLVEKTVFFVVSDASQVLYATPKQTDFAGRAVLGSMPLNPGAYTVTAYFCGTIPVSGAIASPATTKVVDEDYLPSVPPQIQIQPQAQTCSVVYTGDSVAAMGGTLHMAAQVTVPTGTDVTLALVKFVLLDVNGNPVPGTEIVAPVDADGVSLASLAGLDSAVYQVQLQVIGTSFNSQPTQGASSGMVAIYDPSGSFVTGGGWINSPAGAYSPDPTLVGKATFAFVSKYANGAKVPTGETEFQFQVAKFKFNSTSYDWLVVSGAKAQYKGSGTINGAGNYSFLLTAIDGQLSGGGGSDKFRIKIIDKVSGRVIYDNQLGAADTTDPTTVIGGGSIVIHK